MNSLYGALCADPALATAALLDPILLQRDNTFTKIFVGGLPYHTTDKALRDYFEQFGDLEEAVVITDRQTGKSKGYGFVTMRDRLGAELACKDPNPIIDGRKANVNLAYLGAKPRMNALQLAGLSVPVTQAALPSLLPNRLGLQTLYMPTSPVLTSPSLIMPPMSPLSPSGGQYFDYAAANSAYPGAQYATAAGALEYPYSLAGLQYGVMPGAYAAQPGAGTYQPSQAAGN